MSSPPPAVRVADLWPPPREAEVSGEVLALPDGLRVRPHGPAGPLRPAAERLRRSLTRSGSAERTSGSAESAAEIRLEIDPLRAPDRQGYELVLAASGSHLVGGDAAGLFHGVCTLAQWIALHPPGELGALVVRDRPEFARRGVMLDVSRNRVPTLEALFELVDRLASWKINELQLYTEHTFAYRGHEPVWADASPMTAEEIRHLDAYCRRHFIELVPNQNSFGHFHRWLVHEPYRRLAECPQGIEHPFSDRSEPFGLCPTDPGSLDLLRDLYDQLLPNFASDRLNVGFDETIDLGCGRSAEACRIHGTGRVYLDFLRDVHRLAAERGRRIQVWGDIVLQYPELIAEIPSDVIALDWGYEADHPFADETRRFAEAGLDFYVCPGTSSWNSFGTRGDNAIRNLAAAARHGAGSAAGYLITDWGDLGHLQPFAVSYLGLLAGAGFAWNSAAATRPERHDWARLLDCWAFVNAPPGLGATAVSLADAYRVAAAPISNGSALFFLLIKPDDNLEHTRYRELGTEGLEAALAHVTTVQRGLTRDTLASRELDWVANALALGARMGLARLATGRAAPIESLPRQTRRDLEAETLALADNLRTLWLERSRPGGLSASAGRLTSLANRLG